MWITEIYTRNIAKLPDMNTGLGAVIMVSGGNGKGKTTFTRTLPLAFKKGHHGRMLRASARQGEVRLTLSDGGKVEVKITEKETNSRWVTPDGRQETAKKQIQALAKVVAFNPLQFLEMDPPKREETLREILPMEFKRSEIDQAIGEITTLKGDLDLAGFDQFLAAREADRTAANAARDNLEGTLNTFQEGLGVDDGEDWLGLYDKTRATLTEKRQLLNQKTSAAERLLQETISDLRTATEQRITAYAAEQRRLLDLELDSVKSTHDKQVKELTSNLQAEIENLVRDEVAQGAKAVAKQKAAGLREKVAEIEGNLKAAAVKATKAQRVVDNLRELRRKRMDEAIDVPGIELRGGQILVNGLDLDTEINTAEQYRVLLEIFARAAGYVSFIVLDRCESLEPQKLKWITDGAKALGLQVFLTKMVPAAPLTVENLDPEEAFDFSETRELVEVGA